MRRLQDALIALVLMLSCSATVGAEPLVQKLLPPEGSVKEFKISPGSLIYGKGNDLTKIYNGAVDLYKKNGVVDAARQIYQRKDDFVEVTTHTMTSSKTALAFLKYWQKEHKIKSLTKTKTRTSFWMTNPNVMLYFVVGRYFVTVGGYYQHDRARKDAAVFASVIEKRILQYGGR